MALRIRDLREDNDFTQAEIAALLNVSQAILADYYHTSVDYLLGRTNIPEPYPKK